MEHAAVLAIFLGSMTTIVSIGVAIGVYRHFPGKFLAHFIAFLGLILVGSLAELVRGYVAVNVEADSAFLSCVFTLAIALPTFAGLLNLIRSAEDVLQRRLPWVTGSFLVVALLQILTSVLEAAELTFSQRSADLVLALSSALVAILLVLAVQMIWHRAGPPGCRSRAIRFAGLWLGVKILIDFTILATYSMATISATTARILQGASETASALVVILFVRRFSKAIAGWSLAAGGTENPNPLLIGEYAISPREREIVEMVMRGLTNKEIAEQLHISASTVKDHIYNVYQKTDVKNRVQLVNLFRE